MNQIDLFRKPMDEQFLAFHQANPKVYELFERFATEAHQAGRRRIGAKMLAERIRWFEEVEVHTGDFKINNSYVSRYARLVAQRNPHLAGLFAMRKLKS